MMRKNELIKYNEETFTELKNEYNDLQLGFFKNNFILFVGQNPGNPFNDKTQELTQNVITKKGFKDFEIEYFNSIYNSIMGKFLKSLCGENWNHISFTNIVKIPSIDNTEPSQEMTDEFLPILKKQINLLQPNLVVLIGKFAGNQFGLENFYEFKKIDNIDYFLIPHPSYINRNTIGERNNIIYKIKMIINNWLKYNAIIKVTKFEVYYRNISFEKKSFLHNEQSDFCFIECEEESEYKSFDGKNLKKVDKYLEYHEQTYEKHLTSKHIFHYNNVDKISYSKMIRYMLFDIENDFCNDIINTPEEVTSISYYDNLNDQKVCYILEINNQIIKEKEGIIIKQYKSEINMLKDFFNDMNKFDVVCGWYSNGFDIPYLLNRAKYLGIDLNEYFNRLYINIDEKDIKIYQETCVFYDALEFYKRNTYYNKPPAYGLGIVANFLFGDDKIEHQGVDILWREDINKLIDYNLHDVELLKKICDSNSIINYPLQLQQLCPQDFENVFFNSVTIENLLHYRYWKKNIYFPTKVLNDKVDVEGAIVFDPIKGTHHNVAVFDFSAMYTNVFLSFNYSPDTLIGKKDEVELNFENIKIDLINRYPELKEKFEKYSEENKEECLKQWILINNDFGEFYFLPTDWKEGILPKLERELLNYRKFYTEQRDSYNSNTAEYKIFDELQGQAKTILNSVYGITSYNKFILYSPIITSSITSTARKLLTWVKQQSENQNFQCVTGDSDSIFIKFPHELTFEEFINKAKIFCNVLNDSFKDFMKMLTNNENMIQNHTNKIGFEKGFLKLFITDVKKRYFGYNKYYKGKILSESKLAVTGFETRRDDTPNYFKQYLFKIYEIFLNDNIDNNVMNLYKDCLNDIKNVNIDDLIIRLKLSKDIESYQNLPIHVRALKNSDSKIRRGETINMIYVKDKREVIHYDQTIRQNFIIDYDKYLLNFFINKVKLLNNHLYEKLMLKYKNKNNRSILEYVK